MRPMDKGRSNNGTRKILGEHFADNLFVNSMCHDQKQPVDNSVESVGDETLRLSGKTWLESLTDLLVVK